MRTIPSHARRTSAVLLLATLAVAGLPSGSSGARTARCAAAEEAAFTLGGFPASMDGQEPHFYYTSEGVNGRFRIDAFFDCSPGVTSSVGYETPPGSPGPATAGTDYTSVSGTETFTSPSDAVSHYEASRNVTVPVQNDAEVEAVAERVNVRLVQQDGPLGVPSQAPLFIVDDDGSTRLRFVDATGRTVPENFSQFNGELIVPVLRAGPTTGTITFSVSPASDVSPTSGNVQWSGDGRLGTIPLTIQNDTTCESTETFSISLSGAPMEGPATFPLTITDNDTCGTTHMLDVARGGTQAGTVTSDPAGITCGTDCTHDYAEGTQVTLTATPDAGQTFTEWSGACMGTSPTCTVTMSADRTVTASFAVGSFQLLVSKGGTGLGTITSSPDGIECGGDCSHTYSGGTSVTLTASASSGSTFAGWGGDCASAGTNTTCVVVMNANRSVSATFNPETVGSHTLTITRTGSGTVTSAPAGISCGSDCSQSYTDGTSVALTASPASGWAFGGWGGDCAFRGTAPTCTLVVDRNRAATAAFHAPLTVSRTGSGTVSSAPAGISCGSDCSHTYAAGTSVDLTATPATGWEFAGWTGVCSATSTLCHVTMDGPRSVGAVFVEEQGDEVPPRAWFHHPKHGELYREGSPFADTIHLFATDDLGHANIAGTQLALRKKMTGGGCRWWRAGRWRAGDCSSPKWIDTGRGFRDGVRRLVIYSAYPPLTPSVGTRTRSYQVLGRAFDEVGNRSRLVTGENRNAFEVRRAA